MICEYLISREEINALSAESIGFGAGEEAGQIPSGVKAGLDGIRFARVPNLMRPMVFSGPTFTTQDHCSHPNNLSMNNACKRRNCPLGGEEFDSRK